MLVMVPNDEFCRQQRSGVGILILSGSSFERSWKMQEEAAGSVNANCVGPITALRVANE